MNDTELIAKADTWLNDSSKQNWRTDARAIGFISSLMLQHRKGQELSAKQKDYMFAILFRCYNES